MHSPRRPQIHLVFGLALALGGLPALAAPDNVTRGEMALLPEYCPETQTFAAGDARTTASGARWRSLLGPTFGALHHYCWGLISVQRARAPGIGSLTRRGLLMSSINDFTYVLQNATPDFLLLPEIYLRIGETQTELQAYAEAMEAFTLSRRAKPDYWPAYVRAATVLVRIGKTTDAIGLLEVGLTRMPKEPALIEAYKRLGGDYAKFIKTLPPERDAGGGSAKAPASTAGAESPAQGSPGSASKPAEPAASAAQ